MTFTTSPILFPIIATVVVFVFGVMFARASEKGTFGDPLLAIASLLCFIVGVPFIWTIYFSVLYFLK